MEVSGQIHDSAALPPGKVSSSQSRSGRGSEGKKSLPLPCREWTSIMQSVVWS